MADSIIGIKELHRNLKRVADAAVKGKSFTVVRDSRAVFRIEPMAGTAYGQKKKYRTMSDILKAARFSDPDPHLSQKIDEIVYGGRS